MAGSVLLIDDDVDVLRSVGKYLEQLGYEEAGTEIALRIRVPDGYTDADALLVDFILKISLF